MGVTVTPSFAQLRNKPNTVAGFGITDMASQSVASAVNATNAATVSNITTAQVLAANAGASVGAVGTYAFLQPTATITLTPGTTRAGSGLRYAAAFSGTPSVTTAGTWLLMGGDGASSTGLVTWLRIS